MKTEEAKDNNKQNGDAFHEQEGQVDRTSAIAYTSINLTENYDCLMTAVVIEIVGAFCTF